jgi:hypothetical protein
MIRTVGRHPWAAVAGVALAAGCNPPRGIVAADGTSSTTSGADTTSGTSDVPLPAGPPTIVDLGASVLTLTEGETTVVTAVVHDPDGDVVAGTLLHPTDALVYGAFEPGPSDRWTVTLTWDALHLDPELAFEGTTEVHVRARFVDAQDGMAEATLPLRLNCSGLAGADCDGACVDLDNTTEHCGACGHVCRTVTLRGEPTVGGCLQQACQPTWSPCFSTDRFADCNEACASVGGTCGLWDCGRASFRLYPDPATCEAGGPGDATNTDTCAPLREPWAPGTAVRCCCTTG